MKGSKRTIFKQSVILSGIAGSLLLISACSSTKVLEDNGDIPAPSLTPPENANELVTKELQAQPIVMTPEQPSLIQTATSVPGFKEGVEGKVKYTIQRGDSLWKVSKMFDVSVRELAAYNNIELNKNLKIGTILQIPPSGLAAPKAIESHSKSDTTKHKKNATKTTLKKTNGATHHTANTAGTVYTVKKGDSLKSVAKKHGLKVKELLAANHNLSGKSKLKPGQKINIPGKAEKSKTSTAKQNTKGSTKQVAKPSNDLINKEAIDTSKATDNKSKGASSASATSSTSTAATPAATTAAASTPATTTPEQKAAAPASNYLPHTVKDADTWQTISDMYGLSVDDLKKANPSITGEPKAGVTVNIPEE